MAKKDVAVAPPLGALPPYPVGFKGEAWPLWCPDHPKFWGDSKHDRCRCGYQTYEEKVVQGCYICAGNDPDYVNARQYCRAHANFAATPQTTPSIREFSTGATRDTDNGKFDYEAFLSPIVLRCYAEFMHKNRQQADGSLRSGDNWQKGIPQDVYMKSLTRHFMAAWLNHRGQKADEPLEEALCAILFNTMGYLFEMLREG